MVAAYGLRGAEKVGVEDQVAAQLMSLGRDAQRSVLGRVQQRIAAPRVELGTHVRIPSDASVSNQSAMVAASGASWAHLPVVCPRSHTSRATLVSDQSVNGHERGISQSIVSEWSRKRSIVGAPPVSATKLKMRFPSSTSPPGPPSLTAPISVRRGTERERQIETGR